MVLLIAFAILGAGLGAYLRPRPLAIVLALGLSAGVRGGLDFIAHLAARDANDPPKWLATLDGIITPASAGYVPVIAAAAGGAVFSAVMCMFFDETPYRPFWMPAEGGVRTLDRNGRYKRVADMIEERSIHRSAEARLHAAHDGDPR